MKLYTIGFTKRTAEQFYEEIKSNNIKMLLDIRLNNTSQLAGFTKGKDLEYFLREICGCGYFHLTELAPTDEIMKSYKTKKIIKAEFDKLYTELIAERNAINGFYDRFEKYGGVCLLCSEPAAKDCHRGVLAEILFKKEPCITVNHL